MEGKTGTTEWSVVAHDAGELARAVESLGSIRTQPAAERERAAYDVLISLTAVGSRLANLLDDIAAQFEHPGIPEQRATHIALDQAAAAADDLGACARRAADALASEE